VYVVYEYRRYLPYFIGEITGGTLYGGHPTRCSRQDSARTLCAIESALPFLGACQSRRHDGLRTQIREQPHAAACWHGEGNAAPLAELLAEEHRVRAVPEA